MRDVINNVFERLLVSSRWMILLVVISGILSALLMVAIGTYEVYTSMTETLLMVFGHTLNVEAASNTIMSNIISSIDAYLIATVLLLFSVGLYELFISKIDHFDTENTRGKILEITNLDQLKEKLGKLIIMILIVSFFERAINLHIEHAVELLYIGLSILFVSLAIFVTHIKKPGSPSNID